MASRGEADLGPSLESSSYLGHEIVSSYDNTKGETSTVCVGEDIELLEGALKANDWEAKFRRKEGRAGGRVGVKVSEV